MCRQSSIVSHSEHMRTVPSLILLCVALACGKDSAAPWTVSADHVGPLPLGAPIARVNEALGDSLAPDYTSFEQCAIVRSPRFPAGVSLLVERDSVGGESNVERVNVDSAGVLTAEGIGVGDSEARAREVYGQRLTVQPHKYTGPQGHYLVVRGNDSTHRIIFETDGANIVRYYAGRRPAVELVEGCA
jgi:hypothetical protein